METLEVRIVTLAPMRVASFHGFSATPEMDALAALQAWASTNDIPLNQGRRIFGFNNPNPSAGSPNYGYEVWLTLPVDFTGEGDGEIKTFAGGLYAVSRSVGVENIGATWKQLVQWREHSPYREAQHQWLEEQITPLNAPLDTFELDLYIPIRES